MVFFFSDYHVIIGIFETFHASTSVQWLCYITPVIYLDHHSTTPLDPKVFEAMAPFFLEHFGNPGSTNHSYGWVAHQAVEKARSQVARVFGVESKEIVFTSGATESISLALRGTFELGDDKNHFISSDVEHKATLETLGSLERRGAKVTQIKSDRYGQVTTEQVVELITPHTKLVSLIYGNNEIGSVNPIAEIGAELKRRGVLFHVDAAQCVGRLDCQAQLLNADLISISAHKIYGPKGVGALFVRSRNPRVRLAPQILGGGQERGLRSGTLNVPGIVGMGQACEIALNRQAEENARLTLLRDRFIEEMKKALPGTTLNGHPSQRLPHNVSLTFDYPDSDSLLRHTLGVAAVSIGSACATSDLLPSHVLSAIGLTDTQARKTIRFGLGLSTTWDQLNSVLNHFRGLWGTSRNAIKDRV